MRLVVFILFFCAISTLGFGQTKSELERQKLNTQKELELAKQLLDKTTIQKENSLRRLALLNKGINVRSKLIETIGGEIDILDLEIDNMEAEIRKLRKNIESGRQEYAKIIYSIYINHTEEDKLMFLLASADLNQFYQRIKYMKYLKEYRERKIAELEALRAELENQSAELLKARNSKAQLLEEKEAENRNLLNERSERNRLVTRLSQDEKRIRREIREKERIRKELEDKIRKIIEEEVRKSSSNSLYATLTPEQKLIGNNFLQNKGRLPWPVERGVITEKFGSIPHPVLKNVKIESNGINISSAKNSKARAIFGGEVQGIYAILGANYVVLIKHGEYLSVYQNLVDLKVKAGDTVEAKQELGTIHAEENVSVLHLEIWKSKEILDPSLWLSK